MMKITPAILSLVLHAFPTEVTSEQILIGEKQDESSVLLGNLVDSCVINFDPSKDVDYFPTKYQKPTIKSYGNVDVFGEKFVPHNTTDYLDIQYFNTYKIVTNAHQDPPRQYLLYQCGTEIPQDVVDNGNFDLVVPVPHKGGLALTQTPQIPYVEMLGLREEVIAYIGDSYYVTSPCLKHMMDESGSVEVLNSNYNATLEEELLADFRERHPEAIIVSGPTNNVVGDQVVVSSATQERTNVAIFDWISFYAAFYNLEGRANRISAQLQDSYDCSSDVARTFAEEERDRDLAYAEPVIFWANHISWNDLGWSVAECPTWDHTYYCEYATHCGATILSRPEGFGYNQTWGIETYWYLDDDEVLEMAKNADVFIYSGTNWEETYETKKDLMDQFKSVQNKQVFDLQGQGSSAWFEQRFAEYDVVGLDVCDVVGHTSKSVEHKRRWLRNVFEDPVGALETCDVEGGEISRAYVPPQQECVRPTTANIDETEPEIADVETEPEISDLEDSAASASSLLRSVLIMMAVLSSAIVA